MQKYFEGAYWFYTLSVFLCVFLGVMVLLNYDKSNFIIMLPNLGAVDPIPTVVILMTSFMAVGYFYSFPLFVERYSEQKKLVERTAKLEVAVVTDPLTGLYNRRYFEDALREYLLAFNSIDAPLALLTVDIDEFKKINDTHGHDVGDFVLKCLSAELKKLIREHDVIARTGGEEFCIIAPFHDDVDIIPFAERLCSRIADMKVDLVEELVCPTVSIGVASTMKGVNTAKELIKISDEQLYKAKSAGRNRVCYKNVA